MQKAKCTLFVPQVQIKPKTLVPTDKLEPKAAAWVESVGGEAIGTVEELVGSERWEQVKEKGWYGI